MPTFTRIRTLEKTFKTRVNPGDTSRLLIPILESHPFSRGIQLVVEDVWEGVDISAQALAALVDLNVYTMESITEKAIATWKLLHKRKRPGDITPIGIGAFETAVHDWIHSDSIISFCDKNGKTAVQEFEKCYSKKKFVLDQSVADCCGILFSVETIAQYLDRAIPEHNHTCISAAIYLVSVMEYLTTEIIYLAGNAAGLDITKHGIIGCRDIAKALHDDEELRNVYTNIAILHGGEVFPIHNGTILPEPKKSVEDDNSILLKNLSQLNLVHVLGLRLDGSTDDRVDKLWSCMENQLILKYGLRAGVVSIQEEVFGEKTMELLDNAMKMLIGKLKRMTKYAVASGLPVESMDEGEFAQLWLASLFPSSTLNSFKYVVIGTGLTGTGEESCWWRYLPRFERGKLSQNESFLALEELLLSEVEEDIDDVILDCLPETSGKFNIDVNLLELCTEKRRNKETGEKSMLITDPVPILSASIARGELFGEPLDALVHLDEEMPHSIAIRADLKREFKHILTNLTDPLFSASNLDSNQISLSVRAHLLLDEAKKTANRKSGKHKEFHSQAQAILEALDSEGLKLDDTVKSQLKISTKLLDRLRGKLSKTKSSPDMTDKSMHTHKKILDAVNLVDSGISSSTALIDSEIETLESAISELLEISSVENQVEIMLFLAHDAIQRQRLGSAVGLLMDPVEFEKRFCSFLGDEPFRLPGSFGFDVLQQLFEQVIVSRFHKANELAELQNRTYICLDDLVVAFKQT